MNGAVAIDAHGQAVLDDEAKVGKIGERLDVVGVQVFTLTTFRTSISVTREHGQAPDPQWFAKFRALIGFGHAALPRWAERPAAPR